MSYREEVMGKTQDLLQKLYFSAGLRTSQCSPPKELEEVAGEREVWGLLLRLLPPQPGWMDLDFTLLRYWFLSDTFFDTKKEITSHITVQIFSFIFQLSISITGEKLPKGLIKLSLFPIQAVFLQKKLITNNFQCKTVANR